MVLVLEILLCYSAIVVLWAYSLLLLPLSVALISTDAVYAVSQLSSFFLGGMGIVGVFDLYRRRALPTSEHYSLKTTAVLVASGCVGLFLGMIALITLRESALTTIEVILLIVLPLLATIHLLYINRDSLGMGS